MGEGKEGKGGKRRGKERKGGGRRGEGREGRGEGGKKWHEVCHLLAVQYNMTVVHTQTCLTHARTSGSIAILVNR